MKYFIFAVLAVFLAYPASAELMTEAEAAAESQAYWDNFYRHPQPQLSAEERRKSDLEQSIKDSSVPKKYYSGSGSYISDRDVYIDGKLYHCVKYQFNTQCHTH